jgi:hypothetical protein
MPLAAQTIVDLTATAVAAAAGLSATTFTDRAWPLDAGGLPAALVIAGDEQVEPGTVHGLEAHELAVLVELRVSAASALDDAMHNLTSAVLTQIHGSAARSARVAAGVQHFHTRSITRSMERGGEAKVGAVDIELIARFYVAPSAPDTIVH